MSDPDQDMLDELMRAKVDLGAVEAPPPGLRSSMRASFVGSPDAVGAESEERAVGETDDLLSAPERVALTKVEPAPRALRDSIRAGLTGGGQAAADALADTPPPIPRSTTQEGSGKESAHRPRWVPFALVAAAAAALVLVLTQRSDLPTAEGVDSVDVAADGSWKLVSAPPADQLILSPAPGTSSGEGLIEQLSRANIVEVGGSALSVESDEGSRVVLLSGARLGGGPFSTRKPSAADPRVLALDAGQLLLRCADRQPGGLIIATHFGDIHLEGVAAVSANDVGLVVAVVEGEATFQPTPQLPLGPDATPEQAKEAADLNASTQVAVDQLMVVPYPNTKAVLTGFDTDLCRSSEELTQFIELLQHFQRTGELR